MIKNIPELDKLFQEIGEYRESAEFKELLKFIKKFPKIAPYNAMLIHIQKPGSSFVASATTWMKKYKRRITPGARPLVILRPFGPVAFVFDLSDTEGEKDFPEELLNPFGVKGKLHESYFSRLIDNMKCEGIRYNEADYGTNRAGQIGVRYSDIELIINKTNKEIRTKKLYDMVVNKNHEQEVKFTTILHELGHLYCGHLGSPYPKWWSDRRHLKLNEREFEAECTAWLVCERMGINNPSSGYLNGYLDENKTIPDISLDTVLKAVAQAVGY